MGSPVKGKFEHLKHIRSMAVVGAMGLVGKEFVGLLAENRIHIPKLKLLAATDSMEELISDPSAESGMELLGPEAFKGVEVAFFAAPEAITRKFLPTAMAAGCVVVDDSGVSFKDSIPLVVPQINGALLRNFQGNIIANPDCGATALAMCLKPIHDRYGIERVIVSTYQPASDAGNLGFQELSKQTVQLLNGEEVESDLFPHPLAFNCVPMIGLALDDGSAAAEARLAAELQRLLDLPDLAVNVTAVRVPTFSGYGASVTVELREKYGKIDSVREVLDAFSGLKVLDNPGAGIYPTNRECIGSDFTFVGRLRKDASVASGVSFWVMTDNLRKGAALNALECLETLYNYRTMS